MKRMNLVCLFMNCIFTQFYDDEEILRFAQDKRDKDFFNYSSNLLNVENDFLFSNDVEDAKEEFISMVIDYIEGEISYLTDKLEKFKEEI